MAGGALAYIGLPLRCVQGAGCVIPAHDGGEPWESGHFHGHRWADAWVGFAELEVPWGDIEATAFAWYQNMLQMLVTQGLNLVRCWNVVPSINGTTAGMEHYRAFSRGRSLAFETVHGPESWRQMAAATGVGSHGNTLLVAFVAVPGEVTHFENPRQVPAYRYPSEHGPRSPSFARATRARFGGRDRLWVAGTSAVCSHHSVAVGNVIGQTAETLLNFCSLGEAIGRPALLAPHADHERELLIYLRNAGDLPKVDRHLRDHWLGPRDHLSFVHADLCRRELEMEIEVITDWH